MSPDAKMWRKSPCPRQRVRHFPYVARTWHPKFLSKSLDGRWPRYSRTMVQMVEAVVEG